MIFYFTGTGNSLYAASELAAAQGDRVASIAKLMDEKKDVYRYELGENELLGFVFPVYAWGPPKMVLDFIGRLDVKGKPYVFSLCTCGNDEGSTPKIIRKALARKKLALDSAFSLQMPNNYIIGFDVDSQEAEAEKRKAAALMLSEISRVIGQRKRNINLTIPGKFPALKTALVNPMFNRFALQLHETRHTDVMFLMVCLAKRRLNKMLKTTFNEKLNDSKNILPAPSPPGSKLRRLFWRRKAIRSSKRERSISSWIIPKSSAN